MATPPALNDPRFVGLVAEVLGLFAKRAVGRTVELTGPGRDISFVVDELDLSPAETRGAEPPSVTSWSSDLLRAALESAADPLGTAFAAMEASIDAFQAFASAAGRVLWPTEAEWAGLTVRILDGGRALVSNVRAAERIATGVTCRCGPVLLELAERPMLTIQRCHLEVFLDAAALQTWLPPDALPHWALLQLESGHGSLVARRMPRLGGLVVEAAALDGKLAIELAAAHVAGRRLPLPALARRRWIIDPAAWRTGLTINDVQVSERGVTLHGELDAWSEPLRPAQLLEVRDRLVSALAGRGVTVPLVSPPNAV